MNQEIETLKKELSEHQTSQRILSIDSKIINRKTGKKYFFHGFVQELRETDFILMDRLNSRVSLIPYSDVSSIHIVRNIPIDVFRKMQLKKEVEEKEETVWLGEEIK